MLLPAYTASAQYISRIHMLFDCRLQHQMRRRELLWLVALQLCSNTVPVLSMWVLLTFCL